MDNALVEVFADTLRRVAYLPVQSCRYRGFSPVSGVGGGHDDAVGDAPTVVQIKNIDCIDECLSLKRRYPSCKLGLLNMASEFCPGGGVRKGSVAQEETICRATSLYPSLIAHKYPLEPDEMIFSKDVRIVKDGSYSVLETPVVVEGVLTMPAIRRPLVTPQGRYASDADRETMRNKIRIILRTALVHRLDTLVLGAMGAGAFGNPVEEVAALFREALRGEFENRFRRVVFAILETRHPHRLNAAFGKAFGEKSDTDARNTGTDERQRQGWAATRWQR